MILSTFMQDVEEGSMDEHTGARSKRLRDWTPIQRWKILTKSMPVCVMTDHAEIKSQFLDVQRGGRWISCAIDTAAEPMKMLSTSRTD